MRCPPLAFVFALIALLAAPALAAGQDTISITGSTSLLPFAQRTAEVYMQTHPGVRVSVAGRGSNNGLRSIIDGTADIAGSSRQPKERDRRLARQRGGDITEHLVALGCVAPVVDPANPVRDITLEKLREVFTGRVNNWRGLGGPDLPITALSRDSNSGTYEIFRSMVLGRARPRPDALLIASNGAMVQAVAGNPKALGYVGLGYLTPRVKALTVGGVAASEATVRDGSYPLARPLYFITPGQPQGEVARFLRFAQGPVGQRLAREVGLVPAR